MTTRSAKRRARVCPLCQRTVTGSCPTCTPKQEKEKTEANRQRERQRGSAARRGYGHKWRQAREVFLKQPGNGLCVLNLTHASSLKVIATVVDHIVPHRGDKKLFWDRKNWQPACKACHDDKTRKGE